MSQPPELTPPHDLVQSNREFGDVADLAFSLARDGNTLEIPLLELRDRSENYLGVLVAAYSALSTSGRIGYPEIGLEGDQIVKTATHPTMTAKATLVGLWPHANEGDGEATLHEVEATFTPQPDRVSGPFKDMALAIVRGDNPKNTEILDPKHKRHGEGIIIAHNPGEVPIRGGDGSSLEVTIEGRQELDKKVGIKARMRGQLMAILGAHSLRRITDTNIYTLAPGQEAAEIVLPRGKHMDSPIVRVPEQATDDYSQYLKINSEGKIVAGNRKLDRGSFNPTISLDQAAALLKKPLQWEDITQTFITNHFTKAAVVKALSFASADQRLKLLYEQAQAALENQRSQPLPAKITGRLLVAAALRALPESGKRSSYNTVTSRYYAD